MSNHKQSITVTPEFQQAVEDYRAKQGINSWSSALIQLAKIALEWEGVATPQWGGKREGVQEIAAFLDEMSDSEHDQFLDSIEG